MTDNFPLERFGKLETPFYYYDLQVLGNTLERLVSAASSYGYHVHYAVKSNANPGILNVISKKGVGADCVSWNEIERAMACGFKSSDIVFAGVGKTDKEIRKALEADIFCFNSESGQELQVIDSIAAELGKRARVALRINPYVDAHTHKHITTGIEESKFGITMPEMEQVVSILKKLKNIELAGIHFHIGSQITRMQVFRNLCAKMNEILDWFYSRNINIKVVNAGGGLGINYEDPAAMPDFAQYFGIFNEMIRLRKGQELHFEPGRAVTAQCGTLVTRVLYIKHGESTNFAVVDAGMTDLIRPALYQAYHMIQNLSSKRKPARYDVVGPVCESTDTFGKYVELPETSRGDIIVIRSAGAYGEAMASRYNLRDLPDVVFSE
ncbi:MAG: diaminopimelate decarboxylase [Bacteroidales bacterium]